MIEFLKPYAKTSTRSKVFKFALMHTYETYKNLKV